jgi:predicted phosphoribosyltransferase
MEFKDRRDAGRKLANALGAWRGATDVLVLGVAAAAACLWPGRWRSRWGRRSTSLVVRKLGFPGQEEFAMGAIASGSVRVMGDMDGRMDRCRSGPSRPWWRASRRSWCVASASIAAIARARLAGKVLLLIDDGLATGATMCAAVKAARMGRPERIVVAVLLWRRARLCRTWTRSRTKLSAFPRPSISAPSAVVRGLRPDGDEEVCALLRRPS